MRYLRRGEQPPCLDNYDYRYHSWDFLHPECRAEIRRYLEDMQGQFCAYCESHIPSNRHIDHFHPRQGTSHRKFSWDNLFLSCNYARHCGSFKDNRSAGELVKPDEENPENFFRFYKTGEIYPRQDLDDIGHRRAKKTIEVLNLNADELVAKRKGYVDGNVTSFFAILEDITDDDSGEVFWDLAQEVLDEILNRIQGSPYETAIRLTILDDAGLARS